MKIFLSCSSSNDVSNIYKAMTSYLCDEISKENDLVFGCANRGLMGICYNKFKNNNRNIYGVCYTMYKDDLEGLDLTETYFVNNLAESNEKLLELSDVIIVLPGGYGTITEFMHILEFKRTKLHNKEIILFNINGFFDSLIHFFDEIKSTVSINYDYDNLIKVFNTVEEINNYIKSR